jgi:RNA polymerase sigma factor (sigma-70 family)
MTDAEVIKASLAEPSAFGELFDRHAAVLLRYLVRRVGPNDADGLLGELWRIAFERRSSYDCDRADARPWLYGIATNLLSNHRRSEARRINATVRMRTVQSEDVEPDDKLDAAVLWPKVASAVAELPDTERSVLLLYAWENLSYEEIAASLDIPIGTVRSRLNRARARIRNTR